MVLTRMLMTSVVVTKATIVAMPTVVILMEGNNENTDGDDAVKDVDVNTGNEEDVAAVGDGDEVDDAEADGDDDDEEDDDTTDDESDAANDGPGDDDEPEMVPTEDVSVAKPGVVLSVAGVVDIRLSVWPPATTEPPKSDVTSNADDEEGG